MPEQLFDTSVEAPRVLENAVADLEATDPDLVAKIERLLALSEDELLAMIGEEFMKLPADQRAALLAEGVSSGES